MLWIDDAVKRLAAQPICGYRPESPPATEPTALSALAVLAAGHGAKVTPALDWLLTIQSPDGSLGIDAASHQPSWPTGWAVVAWNSGARQIANARAAWSAAAARAVDWLLAARGRSVPPSENIEDQRRVLGHDTTLRGWPWVDGTHSWVEPTAIALLALRSAEKTNHANYREAVKLLLNRQLRDGGWNYGNTTVLDHTLYPQVQPTGIALAALAGEPHVRAKLQVSFDYLRRSLSRRTTAASLSYALLGLASHGLWPPGGDDLLRSAYRQTLAHGGSLYCTALLVLAAKRRFAELFAPPTRGPEKA